MCKKMYEPYSLLILTLAQNIQVAYIPLVYLKEIYSYQTHFPHMVPGLCPLCAGLDIETQNPYCYYSLSTTYQSVAVADY